jgi:yjeF C-terminal region, hydroxyethylthiazole kinase-related/yjeF N-terminal region
MKYVVNSSEMKAIDEYTISNLSVSQEELMERAANEVVKVMKQRLNKEDHILVVCGPGNNGGDGIAAGRILYLQGYHVAILFIGDSKKASQGFLNQLQIARNLNIPMEHSNKLCEYNIIIDALFGVGLSRPITGEFESIINQINEHKTIVYSVDIPSGISADDGSVMNTAIRANHTITFGYQKMGLLFYPGADYAGEIHIADIGFAPIQTTDTNVNTVYFDEEDLKLLPIRSNYSNKGSFGKVLVIAGSKGMSGAAYLSAKAAYRTGAGMVKILTAEDNRIILQSILPEALFAAYDDSSFNDREQNQKILEDLQWADVIVFGPGLGVTKKAEDLSDIVLKNQKKPLILDADGINLLAKKLDAIDYNCETERKNKESNTFINRLNNLASLLAGQTVLTPHLMELSRLIGIPISDIINNLVDTAFQCSYNKYLVYAIKDARSIVVHGDQKYINISGNNGMATAGSGDVLTGIIAGLAAQGMELFEATCLGLYLHGLAGDEAAKRKGKYSLMASDIVNHIETVLQKS